MKISKLLSLLFLVLNSCFGQDTKQESKKIATKTTNIYGNAYHNSTLNVLINNLLLKNYEKPINKNDWDFFKKETTQSKGIIKHFTQEVKTKYSNDYVLLYLNDAIEWTTVSYIDISFICFLADNGKFLVVDFKNNLYISFNFLAGQPICIENLEYVYLLDTNFFPYLRITGNIYEIFNYDRLNNKISGNLVYFEKAYHKNILNMNYKDLIKINEHCNLKKYQLNKQSTPYNEIFFKIPMWVEY